MMQVGNEKVIVGIPQMLNLIKQIRSLTLLLKIRTIRKESKTRRDNHRNYYSTEIISLREKIIEIEIVIEEASKDFQGV